MTDIYYCTASLFISMVVVVEQCRFDLLSASAITDEETLTVPPPWSCSHQWSIHHDRTWENKLLLPHPHICTIMRSPPPRGHRDSVLATMMLGGKSTRRREAPTKSLPSSSCSKRCPAAWSIKFDITIIDWQVQPNMVGVGMDQLDKPSKAITHVPLRLLTLVGKKGGVCCCSHRGSTGRKARHWCTTHRHWWLRWRWRLLKSTSRLLICWTTSILCCSWRIFCCSSLFSCSS